MWLTSTVEDGSLLCTGLAASLTQREAFVILRNINWGVVKGRPLTEL